MMIELGSIAAAEMIFQSARSDWFYILHTKDSEPDYIDHWRRFPGASIKRTSDVYIDDTEGDWFAFYVADCFDPPFVVIRSKSFETAYEVFCDEFSSRIKIDDADIGEGKDYDAENINFSASGVPIDTDNVQGHQLTPIAITFRPVNLAFDRKDLLK